MKRILFCTCVSFRIVGGIAQADQRRIPVFQPGALTQPGSYVLTRNITAASGIPIVIQASNITLDLNGHTITGGSSVARLIEIQSPYTDIRIENGRLIGGIKGIHLNAPAGNPGTSVSIHAVDFSDQIGDAVSIDNALSFEMTSCSITNVDYGVIVSGPGPSDPRASIRIVGNRIAQVSLDALTLLWARSALVYGNVFSEVSMRGMYIADISEALITKNVFGSSVSTGTSEILMVDASGLILDNTFRGMETAVWVSGSGSRIAGNQFVGPPAAAGGSPSAVILGSSGYNGDRTLIELNKIDMHSGCGLRFSTAAHDNIFRLNTLRGSGGLAVCDNGTGNTDAGANVY